MPTLSLLLLGDADRREFREARDRLTALGRVQRAGNVEEAAAILADASPPVDVIVVAQARPGEFSHDDVQRLRQIAPLARIVALLGSWCEGGVAVGRAVARRRPHVLASVACPRRSGTAPPGRRGMFALGRCRRRRRRKSDCWPTPIGRGPTAAA